MKDGNWVCGWLLLGLGGALAGACGGATECRQGSLDCGCYPNGTCDAGLVCSAGLCEGLGLGGAAGVANSGGMSGGVGFGGAAGNTAAGGTAGNTAAGGTGAGGTAAGGATNAGGAAGITGGAAGTAAGGSATMICDMRVVVESSCAFSICHGDDPIAPSFPPANGLNWLSPSVAMDLLNRPASYAEVIDPENCPSPPELLINSADPMQSLVIKKLQGMQTCGDSMPAAGVRITAEHRECMINWVLSVAQGGP